MKKENFGFCKLSIESELAIRILRAKVCAKVCEVMAEWKALIGFKDDDDMIRVLSCSAVDVCRDYVGDELIKANPERFDNFVKLVLSDIVDKIKKAA